MADYPITRLPIFSFQDSSLPAEEPSPGRRNREIERLVIGNLEIWKASRSRVGRDGARLRQSSGAAAGPSRSFRERLAAIGYGIAPTGDPSVDDPLLVTAFQRRYRQHAVTGVIDAETIAVEHAPRDVLRLALQTANAIGDGFYGVDIKEVDGRFMVIEVNDNPSIDSGVEDAMVKDKLYTRIMEIFLRKIQNIKHIKKRR